MDLEEIVALLAAPIYAKMRTKTDSKETQADNMRIAVVEAKKLWLVSHEFARQ